MTVLSPLYVEGSYVDHQGNAELLAAMVAAGASFGETEYPVHGADPANAVGIAPGRRVLELPGHLWEHTPDTCTHDKNSTQWLLGGLVLTCRGCGIDCT